MKKIIFECITKDIEINPDEKDITKKQLFLPCNYKKLCKTIDNKFKWQCINPLCAYAKRIEIEIEEQNESSD